jgi:hypothetical protein
MRLATMLSRSVYSYPPKVEGAFSPLFSSLFFQFTPRVEDPLDGLVATERSLFEFGSI